MKRTKKFISLLLAIALVLTIAPWSWISVSAYDAPVLNSDGYYEISTVDHLYWFAEQVNSGNGNTNGYGYINAILLNDIVVNEGDLSGYDGESENTWKEWTPIGNDEYSYSGTFDGAGHTISGLYFNDSTENYIGLFGRYWDQNGKISNIGVINSYFNGCDYVGAICGEAVRGAIQDCYNLSTVKGNSYVGGICGCNSESAKIKNCYNVGEVTGVTYIGGILGYSYDGSSRLSSLKNSYNTGKVIGDSCVGGISGLGGNIESCHNKGDVSGSGEQIGGICGNSYMGSIKLSYNAGSISGYDEVGGICGYGGEAITNCYNSGTVIGECGWGATGGICGWYDDVKNAISYCYNTGTVSGGYSGSICGKTTTTTISNCYYISEETTNIFYDEIPQGIGMNTSNGDSSNIADISGRFELKSALQFASGEIAYLLNNGVTDGTQVWYQNIDNGEVVDDSPRLSGGIVYKCLNCTLEESTFYGNTYVEIHNFDNGICSVCGAYEQPVLVTSENYESLGLTEDYVGYYAISTVANLYWFAEQVNGGNNAINGVLLKDIVVNEGNLSGYDGEIGNAWMKWIPIGTSSYWFSGCFDGAGHTIGGLYVNDSTLNYIGLFGNLNSRTGCFIRNIKIENSYFRGNQYVGAICGYNSALIENCCSDATVKGVKYTGGICGYSFAEIENCYNIGKVIGTSYYVGGISGRGGYSESNCYYLMGCATDGNGTIQNGIGASSLGSVTENTFRSTTFAKTAEQFASGEVAYLLNKGVTDGTQVWYQNIDNGETVDASPKFVGGTVYNCVDICPESKEHYTNNLDCTGKTHSFTDGVCEDCNLAFLNHWKGQIRFDKNEDGTFAGTFDYRVLATITRDDLMAVFGSEENAEKMIVEAGFVMATGTDISDFDYETAKAVVKGTSTAYTKVNVDLITTYFDTDNSTSAPGDYVMSCIVEDIPKTDKNMCLATMAYIAYNDDNGNLCYVFYPTINSVCFEGLYDQYYSLAFPS